MTDKQFEKYAAAHIQELKDSYNTAKQNFKRIGEEEEWERLNKKILALVYTTHNYQRVYIRWERQKLKLPAADKEQLRQYLYVEIMHIVPQAYINFAYKKPIESLIEPYLDDPEKANKPLTDLESEDYTHFLDTVFKPALLEVIKKGKEGAYKPLTEIPAGTAEEISKPPFGTEPARKDLYNAMRDLIEGGAFVSVIPLDEDLQLRLDEAEPLEADIIAPELERFVSPAYPKNFLVDLTKAGKQLSDIAAFSGIDVIVSPNTKKWNKAPAITTLLLTPAKGLTFSRPITFFDRSIINAVETLAQNKTPITPKAIYHQMNGLRGGDVRAERLEDIESRINYMLGIRATIDATAHLNMNGKAGTFIYENYLLNLGAATYTVNGQTVKGYIYNKESPLFTYARAVNQLMEIPAVLLDTRSVQKGSVRADNIKHYLLTRIFTMDGQGRTISFDTLLKEIGEEAATRNQIDSIHRIIRNYLDFWSYGKIQTDSKAKPNVEVIAASKIVGYIINSKGRKTTGYTLIPKADQIEE